MEATAKGLPIAPLVDMRTLKVYSIWMIVAFLCVQAQGQTLASILGARLDRCVAERTCELEGADGIWEISSRLSFEEISETAKFFPKHGLIFSNLEAQSYFDLSYLFDQAHIQAFDTPAGKLMCEHFGPNVSDMSQILGVSVKAATQIIQSCDFPMTKRNSLPAKKNLMSKYRKIIFVVAPKEELVLEGWTTRTGATILFVSPDEANLSHFVHLAIHELATFFDRADHDRLAILKQESTEQFDSYCLVSSILANPLIRLAASSIRAKRVEELFLGRPLLAAGSCQEVLSREIDLVKNVSAKLLLATQIPHRCRPIRFDLNDLEDVKLVFESDRAHKSNVCEFLTNPRLVIQREASTEGGPRPRTTGGWKQNSMADDSSAKLKEMVSSDKPVLKSNEERLKTYLSLDSQKTIDRVLLKIENESPATKQSSKNEK